MSNKLYLVKLRGMQSSLSSGIRYGHAYVVAKDSAKAYEQVLNFLEKDDIGFSGDREMESVELLAENVEYPDCNVRLYLPSGTLERK